MKQSATPICAAFNRQAASYGCQAQLQRAVAWRLAHHIARLPLPPGPQADLGAGTGLLGLALGQLAPHLQLLQLDGSPELLEQNPLRPTQVWNLDDGLPAELQHSALLTSSFTLQWLSQPGSRLQHWARRLVSGGWLVLAVPVAGSFPQWHHAAAQARVPCTAQPLPHADDLIAAATAELELVRCSRLWFSRHYGPGGLAFLQHLRQLGASSSSQPSLSPGQWRQLLECWPNTSLVSWQILLMVGRRDPHR
jgi:malonyl-CoA O-methyltransferase